jgi:hypothetical protein
MRAAIATLVLVTAACQTGPSIPSLEHDLTLMGLRALPVSAPPPRITPERVVDRTQTDYDEPIEPLRLGRRLAAGGETVWVLIYRVPPDPACPECPEWAGRVLDDQSGAVLFGFDQGSWDAVGLPKHEW